MRTRGVIGTSEGSRPEAFGPTEWALLASIAAMWGSSFLLIAIGLEAFHPGLIAFIRVALGCLALGLVRRSRRPVPREDWPRIALLGFLWMAAPLLLFPVAQDLGVASAVAGMVNGAMPLFAAVVAALLLRRLPRARQAAGLAVGFVGVVLITLPASQGEAATPIGVLLLLAATAMYGLSANLAVPLQQRYGALPVVWRAQLVALVALAPVGAWGFPGSGFTWPSAAAVLVLGVLGTGLAFIAMATLVGRTGATRGAVAIYFLPVVALVLGITLRGESVPVVSIGGVALVLVGAWLTSRREKAAVAETPPA